MRAWPLLLLCAACDGSTIAKDARVTAAGDFEKQYEMVKASKGSERDLCTRARLVAEGYLQAQDQQRYGEWKHTADVHCAIADVEATR